MPRVPQPRRPPPSAAPRRARPRTPPAGMKASDFARKRLNLVRIERPGWASGHPAWARCRPGLPLAAALCTAPVPRLLPRPSAPHPSPSTHSNQINGRWWSLTSAAPWTPPLIGITTMTHRPHPQTVRRSAESGALPLRRAARVVRCSRAAHRPTLLHTRAWPGGARPAPSSLPAWVRPSNWMQTRQRQRWMWPRWEGGRPSVQPGPHADAASWPAPPLPSPGPLPPSPAARCRPPRLPPVLQEVLAGIVDQLKPEDQLAIVLFRWGAGRGLQGSAAAAGDPGNASPSRTSSPAVVRDLPAGTCPLSPTTPLQRRRVRAQAAWPNELHRRC